MKHIIWHAAYSRWYDHDRADHAARAIAWGVTADALCYLFWPIRGGSRG